MKKKKEEEEKAKKEKDEKEKKEKEEKEKKDKEENEKKEVQYPIATVIITFRSGKPREERGG